MVTLSNGQHYHVPGEIDEVIAEALGKVKPINTNKREQLFSVPCAFDIETTSFMDNGVKRGTMYIWMFGICDICIIGRTWDEFVTMCDRISELLSLRANRRLIVYVHNLAWEFQFMRNWFTWSKVFSLDERKPVYAITTTGIEFRCSYILTNESLAKVGEHLQKYKVEKKVGDLDYNLARNCETELDETEIGYCINDILVVMAHIREQIEIEGDISRIPLTKTGYVRRFCRNACMETEGVIKRKDNKRKKYRELMKSLTLEPDEYMMLKRAFSGGFTHGNPFYTDRVVQNVTSFDFTSSYPTVMVADMFPMSKGRKVHPNEYEEFEYYLNNKCCIFDVHFTHLESSVIFDSYISRSRCWDVVNAQENNGRIVRADELKTTMTEDDYRITEMMYTWDKDSFEVGDMYIYDKDYLPGDFVKSILTLYKDKTSLKDIEEMAQEYMLKKGMVNSAYGMTVLDPCRPEIPYPNRWLEADERPDVDVTKCIEDYNKSRNRFLFYPWGVFVTSRARRRLFTGIMECGLDYVYSDTDSIKVMNADRHMDYIEGYNRKVTAELEEACSFHGIDFEMIRPKTVKGVEKPLGVWDREGDGVNPTYRRFKYLGAKRYMVEEWTGKVNITVSGLNKKVCVPYIKTLAEDPFDVFTDDLYIPEGYTGKLTHTYIDEETEGELVDYKGHKAHYYEKSCINLSGSEYRLSLASEYAEYIKIIQGISILGRRLETGDT